MAIIKYSTQIEATQSLSEIQTMLAKGGAREITVDYGINGIPISVAFRVLMGSSPLKFRMPSRSAGVYKALCSSKVPKRLKTREQAERVAWRIIRQWVEAQLALVSLEMAEMAEVFLPYAQGHTGETFYNNLKSSSKARALLTGGR